MQNVPISIGIRGIIKFSIQYFFLLQNLTLINSNYVIYRIKVFFLISIFILVYEKKRHIPCHKDLFTRTSFYLFIIKLNLNHFP